MEHYSTGSSWKPEPPQTADGDKVTFSSEFERSKTNGLNILIRKRTHASCDSFCLLCRYFLLDNNEPLIQFIMII